MIACSVLYAGDDKLFVPVENIEVLTRYGSEEPARSSTGSAASAGSRARRGSRSASATSPPS